MRLALCAICFGILFIHVPLIFGCDKNSDCEHGDCVDGECDCDNGWTGTDCSTAICKTGCSHGSCTTPNTCVCSSGWSGTLCTNPICKTGCANGGCTTPNTCVCNTGWSGTLCNTAICSIGCANGGCSVPNTCNCYTGWTGTLCTTPICSPACVHGTCTQPNVCTCETGWNGNQCQNAICAQTCSNGGSCTEPNTCTCATGWAGTNCTTPICTGGCQNGGTCINPETCACALGWTGQYCDTPICYLGCWNGGTCSNPNVCTCGTGYFGEYCQTALCTNPYCNATTSFCTAPDTCTCIAGFTGTNCSQYIDEPLTDPQRYLPEFSLPNHGVYWLDWTMKTDWTGSIVQPNLGIRIVPPTASTNGWIRNKNAFPLTEFTINATVELVRYGNNSQGFSLYIVSNATTRPDFNNHGISYVDPSTNFTGIFIEFNPSLDTVKVYASPIPRTTQSTINTTSYTDAGVLQRYLRTRFRIGIVIRNGNTFSMDFCDVQNCTAIIGPAVYPNFFPMGYPEIPVIIGMSAINPFTSRASVDLIDFRVYSIANCTRDCGPYGFCSKTGDYCVCRTGWTSNDCQSPICNCQNGGTCIWPGICKCHDSFSGDDCSRGKNDGFFSPRHCGRNFRLILKDSFRQISGNVTTQQCADACWRAGSFKCRSFSFFENQTSSQCWLNVGHTNQIWEGLETAPGWRYYHVETFGEIAPCKNNTYRDCTVVKQLGLGPGNYSFQVDVSQKSFNAECITLPPSIISHQGSPVGEPPNLWMVFHKRNRFYDINYANKTYQDYKWGFGSKTNTTNWVGLEWGYRLTSDFSLFYTNYYCVQLANYNATTQYLIIKYDTVSENCAVFTHRQGNLAIATRSTCICKDPASEVLVTCGCNTLTAEKYYHPLNQFGINLYVYEHYRPPWSLGNRRWLTTGTSGDPIKLTETATPTTWYPRPFRWDYVHLYEHTIGTFRASWGAFGTILSEANGYKLYKWNYADLNNFVVPPGVANGNNGFNLPFVAPDKLQGYSNSLGGGYWMNANWPTWQICLTCTASLNHYGFQDVVVGSVNGSSYFLIRSRDNFL